MYLPKLQSRYPVLGAAVSIPSSTFSGRSFERIPGRNFRTFRFLVLNECAVPREGQRFVLSTPDL